MQNYATLLRKRKLPVASNRNNALPWIHVDDAATATAVEGGAAGAYNIVDDKPASWAEMFTTMATTLDTPAPRSLPASLIRLAAPYVATIMLDTRMRASNAKARSELDWKPEYPTLEEGLRAMRTQLGAGQQ